MYTSIVEFFVKGGAFMYPIALVFAAGVAIAIERWVYLTMASTRNRQLWSQVVPLLQQGNFRAAVAMCQKSPAPIGRILNYGLARLESARRRDDVEKAMEESLMEVMPRLELEGRHIDQDVLVLHALADQVAHALLVQSHLRDARLDRDVHGLQRRLIHSA